MRCYCFSIYIEISYTHAHTEKHWLSDTPLHFTVMKQEVHVVKMCEKTEILPSSLLEHNGLHGVIAQH